MATGQSWRSTIHQWEFANNPHVPLQRESKPPGRSHESTYAATIVFDRVSCNFDAFGCCPAHLSSSLLLPLGHKELALLTLHCHWPCMH
jgi:hypothetical protein